MDKFSQILREYLRIDVFDARFTPVERLVYGAVGVILAAVVLSLLYTTLHIVH